MLSESNKSLSRQGSSHSLSQSGHAVPFSPQDFSSPCQFVSSHPQYQGHSWPESMSISGYLWWGCDSDPGSQPTGSGVVEAIDKYTLTTESGGGKGMVRPLSDEESAPTLALTGF